MKYKRYENIEISSDALEYKFVSVGPKDGIQKIVQFKETAVSDVYNLAFRNLNYDGDIDDLSVNDNKDRNKILATVASIVYEFTMQFPAKKVFFAGSTHERTRLYRMAITLNYIELINDFEIYGVLMDTDTFVDVPFQSGIDYFGFLVKRKMR
jgi:hypothetical protein